MGATTREIGSTEQIPADKADLYVAGQAQRVLTKRRNAIQNGTAPVWENHISYFPEKIPQDFPKDFRQHRNKVSAHVKHERAGLSLSKFYDSYHKFLHMLYLDCQSWWENKGEFPDLKEITAFSVSIRKSASTP
jgi:hypothetical protein